MTSIGNVGVWALAAGTAVLNLPLGRLRATAERRSQRWFGLYAAAVFLLLGLRCVFAVTGAGIAALVAAMYLGQWLGRRTASGNSDPSPLRWRVAAYATLAAGLLLFIGEPAHAHGKEPEGNKWERLDADEPAPPFVLTNQNGKRVALRDFRGQVAIVTFLFTHCTDVCPVLPQMLARVDQRLSDAEKAKLRYVGISIDPRRDSPQQLRKFMQERGLSESRWTLLTGTPTELTQAATDYGIVVRPDPRADFVHNTVFVVIDGNGRERVEFHGLATPADEIAKAVRSLLNDRVTAKR